MYKIKQNSINTFDISNYLNTSLLFDKDYIINKPAAFENLSDNSISYIENLSLEELYKIEKKSIVLTNSFSLNNVDIKKIIPEIIFSNDPERDFYLIIKEFFIENNVYKISEFSRVSKNANIGINVNIDEGTIISDNVEIGNNTYIGKNVIVKENVKIGNNCYLKDGSIIGSDSFKFIKENDSSN